MTSATYSILPHLLNAQIMIQNTLLAQLYTTLHNFSQDHGFQSPPPEMEDIIATFEQDFTSLRLEAEGSFKMLTHGKAVHQPMTLGNDSKSYSGLAIRSKTGNMIEERRNGSKQPLRRPSGAGTEPPSPPAYSIGSKPSLGMLSPASTYSEKDGYFDNNRQLVHRASTNSLATTMSNHSIAAKKKPPPPPPPKRLPSHQFEYVIALYDFDGQSPGDLSFREGDRIRIVKKTPNQEDWWEGEKGGVQGAFPANYCKKAPLAGR
jgi:amphiphysin